MSSWCSASACPARSWRRRRGPRARTVIGGRSGGSRGARRRCGWARTGALDPAAGSVAEIVKGETGGRGADVCDRGLGRCRPALAEAIRAVAYVGRVVAIGFFQGEARGLHLGEEFHHNRVRAGMLEPDLRRRPRREPSLVASRGCGRRRCGCSMRGVLDLLPLITARDAVPARRRRCSSGWTAAIPTTLQTVLTFGGE